MMLQQNHVNRDSLLRNAWQHILYLQNNFQVKLALYSSGHASFKFLEYVIILSYCFEILITSDNLTASYIIIG